MGPVLLSGLCLSMEIQNVWIGDRKNLAPEEKEPKILLEVFYAEKVRWYR